MSLRVCCYKNCENYVLNKYATGAFTLFSFPKEEERRERWKVLGGVLPNVPDNELYMCSDHFDQKFIAQSARRMMLVGEALPFPCDEATDQAGLSEDMEANVESVYTVEEEHSETVVYDSGPKESLEEITLITEEDIMDSELFVESTLPDSGVIRIVKREAAADDECEFIVHEEMGSSSYATNGSVVKLSKNCAVKRKLTADTATSLEATSTQNKSLLTNSNHPKYLKRNALADPIHVQRSEKHTKRDSQATQCESSTAGDRDEVTTFIFKGEEYIQMPKRHYIQEKMKLEQKIQQYERILRIIKVNLNSINVK